MNKELPKRHVIYVASIYHSGSTIFDLLTSRLNSTLGLGEVFKFLFDGHEENCSCGSATTSCTFWGQLISDSSFLNRSKSKFYIIREFKELWHYIDNNFPNRLVIDGSKVSPYKFWGSAIVRNHLFDLYRGDIRFDFLPIFLVKDSRAWVASMVRRDLRKVSEFTSISKKILAIITFFLFKNWVFRYVQWCWSTIWLLRKYSKNKDSLFIDYREMCEDPNSLLELLKIKFAKSDFYKDEPGLTHICVGNPSRFTFLNTDEVFYDDRWRKFTMVRLFYYLFPLVWLLESLVREYNSSSRLNFIQKYQ